MVRLRVASQKSKQANVVGYIDVSDHVRGAIELRAVMEIHAHLGLMSGQTSESQNCAKDSIFEQVRIRLYAYQVHPRSSGLHSRMVGALSDVLPILTLSPIATRFAEVHFTVSN